MKKPKWFTDLPEEAQQAPKMVLGKVSEIWIDTFKQIQHVEGFEEAMAAMLAASFSCNNFLRTVARELEMDKLLEFIDTLQAAMGDTKLGDPIPGLAGVDSMEEAMTKILKMGGHEADNELVKSVVATHNKLKAADEERKKPKPTRPSDVVHTATDDEGEEDMFGGFKPTGKAN